MRFVDDTELAVFLWRHISSNMEMRKLVLESNGSLTTRLEEETKDWRFNEADIVKLIEDAAVENSNMKLLFQKLQNCAYYVGKEREREMIDEVVGLQVSVEPTKPIPQTLEQPVRLLTAIISLAVYPKDILSVVFLLSALCSSVLPALKRISAPKKINMAQFLIAYVQKATIDGNDGEDPVMKENMVFLKSFLKTIENIHDKFDEMKDPRKGIRAGFDAANKFLLTCDIEENSNLSPALKLIYSIIDDVVANYKEIMNAAPNAQQSKPSFFNETERVCQAVVDRLTIMIPIQDVISFSPNLRTPAPKSQTPMRGNTQPQNIKSTPSTQPICFTTFINNQTPTPVRNPIQSLHNLLEAEKENIDPMGDGIFIEVNKEKESGTPTRSSKGLRVRRCFGNTNEAKRAPTQRSIMTFFK